MRTTTAFFTIIACALLLALPAAPARANASDDRIVQDCEHSVTGELTGSYSKAQLNHALHNLPGDVSEYTGCHDAIQQALIASASGGGGHGGGGSGTGGGSGGGAGGSGGSGGGTGSFGEGGDAGAASGGGAPVANAKPPAGAEKPLQVAGTAIAPGTLPKIGLDSHRLPTPLIVLLVLLGLAALAAAALTIGPRVVARRRA